MKHSSQSLMAKNTQAPYMGNRGDADVSGCKSLDTIKGRHNLTVRHLNIRHFISSISVIILIIVYLPAYAASHSANDTSTINNQNETTAPISEAPENIVLRFEPSPPQEMYIACLFSHWTPPAGSDEPDLWSFAAVTDDPPPEVAAAGHDRCIVQLRPENVEAWLTPQGRTLDALDALLDDKARPYYEHRLAA